MTQLKFGAVLIVGLLVAGCAASQGETAEQRAFGLQADYNALLEFAVAYESRPRCPAEVPCSDTGVVDKIRTADDAAYAAISEARMVASDPDATKDAFATAFSAARIAGAAMKQLLTEEGLL